MHFKRAQTTHTQALYLNLLSQKERKHTDTDTYKNHLNRNKTFELLCIKGMNASMKTRLKCHFQLFFEYVHYYIYILFSYIILNETQNGLMEDQGTPQVINRIIKINPFTMRSICIHSLLFFVHIDFNQKYHFS